MVTSRVSLIRRHFRRRFGISAPRVGVRSEVRWYWRAILWSGVIAVSSLASLWIYEAGSRFAGFHRGESEREVSDLQVRLGKVLGDFGRVEESSRALEGRLQVEVSTIEQLSLQIRQLQKENARLGEELALFEGLVAAPVAAPDSLKLVRVRVDPGVVPGRYRFSVLLVRQVVSKAMRESFAELQFSFNTRQGGRDAIIAVPGAGNPSASHYKFAIKHFHRAEGEFSLPVGSELIGGEVRVFQDGVVKLRQSIM